MQDKIKQLQAQIRDGDYKALARAITMVENELPGYEELLLNLPEGKRRTVDRTMCDFLKVAWRKRDTVWAALTERKGWRLR